MSPDQQWSEPELARGILRIEVGMNEIRAELRSQRAELVPREVWDEAWRGMSEWKMTVATDIVNLEADAARRSREHDQEHVNIKEIIDARVRAERADRVSGQRWAIGIAATSILGLVGALISMMGGG